MAKIELLPRKTFEISLEDGTKITGMYGTWALARYCDKLGLTLEELTKKLSNGSKISDLMQLILCSVEYICRKEKKSFSYTDLDVSEWIDEFGGIGSPELTLLWNHFVDGEASEANDEKKSHLDGEISSGTQQVQE